MRASSHSDVPAQPPRPGLDPGPPRAEGEFADLDRLAPASHLATASERRVPVYVGEFWTSGQRRANRLHEISYRACFKPQLPAFFIERFTAPGAVVFDPFMGRGTTLLESALRGRIPAGNDCNPLCELLVRPRLEPPTLDEIEDRLASLDLTATEPLDEELLVFFHPETLAEIHALRRELAAGASPVDRWLRMVAINRLTGHSAGFFSVYTLPPNQATSVTAQRRINEKRNQVPPRRDVRRILLKKSKSLLGGLSADDRRHLRFGAQRAWISTGPSRNVQGLDDATVDLVVTSPPFLNVVDYRADNWLRCWFAGIDAAALPLTITGGLETWKAEMAATLGEIHRVLKPGGHAAFEVGEVRKGSTNLDEVVVELTSDLEPRFVMIHSQTFTKTANCWGVDNNEGGTNTHRIVVFRKPPY